MPTCRPWHCCLYQAGSSLKLCRNKTASTFMARFDLVLRTELCRLSNRHCGKTPPDNQGLFISSALSLNARWLLTGRGQELPQRPSLYHREENEKAERENELQFRTSWKSRCDLTYLQWNHQSRRERFGWFEYDWQDLNKIKRSMNSETQKYSHLRNLGWPGVT